MTADQRLAEIQKKVGRAKQHHTELVAKIVAFRNTNPFIIDTKRDPVTRRLIYYLSSVREIPVELSLIAGDIFHNLRSALDHLAYQLLLVGAGNGNFHVAFPIGDDQADFNKKRPRAKGLRQDALDAIDNLQPYRGGNDKLWQLHELSKIDKHRLLVTVGSAFRSLDIGAHGRHMAIEANPDLAAYPHLPLFLMAGDKLFPLEAGAELFIDGPDAEPVPTMQFRFEICLSEPPIIDIASLAPMLADMIIAVEEILTDFKPSLN